MSTLLVILTVLTVISLIILIWGLTDYMRDEFLLVGIFGLFILGLFGWLFWAGCFTLYTKSQVIDCQVERTSRDVIVYPTENKKEIFESKYDYDHINDSTEFYYLIEYNHYGYEIDRTLKYR